MTFENIMDRVLAFRQYRSWEQFHNPKDLAISINLEAAELLELFQWSGANLEVSNNHATMAEEIADIIIYCIYFADSIDVDLIEAINNKIDINEHKYPVEKSQGNSKKYTEL